VQGLALIAAAAIAAGTPTSVDFGYRLARATPDKQGRVAVRTSCEEEAGCNVKLELARADDRHVLGRVFVLLLPHSKETDMIILSKTTRALLERKRTLKVTLTAEVTDSAGNRAAVTKAATLRAPKRRSGH
jgi:hypothetical protein